MESAREGDFIKKYLKELREKFKQDPSYPDFPFIKLFNDYFYQLAFKNYILNILEKYKEQFKEKFLILELGSHKSRTANLLPEDLKDRMIISDINFDILRENLDDVYKIQLDFANIPFKEESLPMIIGTNVFIHLLAFEGIEEIKRILKDEGEVVFVEDLPLYMPGVALFLGKLGYKTFFIPKPEGGEKCFVFEENQFRKITEKIEKFFSQENINNLENLIRENLPYSYGQFTVIRGLINRRTYKEDPFEFSIELRRFFVNLSGELSIISQRGRALPREAIDYIKNLFKNLLKILEEGSQLIEDWEDFIPFVEDYLKERGFEISIERIFSESNIETLEKYQKEISRSLINEELYRQNPFWRGLSENKQTLINSRGLEIGYQGEKTLNEPGVIKYKMLILRLRKT